MANGKTDTAVQVRSSHRQHSVSTTKSDDGPASVPALRDREAWTVPATKAHVAEAVALVVTFVEPDLPRDMIPQISELVTRRGYSKAELAWAANELLYDAELAKNIQCKGHVGPHDFERLIREHRRMRAKLTMKLTLQDMNELIGQYPTLLSIEDFGICDYTAAETPLFRYSFSGKVKDRTPNPQLMLREDTGADRVRTEGDGSAVQIGELI